VRFDRPALALTLAAFLGGCALFARSPWPTGEDPHGRDLKGRAAPIVAALQRFRADAGHWPAHLFELEPKYVPVLPDGLKLDYEPDETRLKFTYQPTAPATGMVTCATAIDALAWDCYRYF
jgi:hypothetical protein